MIKNKKKILIFCLAVVLVASVVGGFFLHQHITTQRELNYIMERQERLNELYNTASRGTFNPELDDDIMEVPQAVISFAGLRSIGFSQEEVEEIWMSSENVRARNSPDNHPDFKETHDFLFMGVPSFEAELRRTLSSNFDALAKHFPELEDAYMAFRDTPLSTLQEIIRLHEAENPPQPRPTTETEP